MSTTLDHRYSSRFYPILVIVGLSGSGRTQVLKSLGDLGYKTIDNLPFSLIPAVIAQHPGGPLALALDNSALLSQADGFYHNYMRDSLARRCRFIFLDCQSSTLQRRFYETRKHHPIGSIDQGIRQERRAFELIKTAAHDVIDTTRLNPYDLHRLLIQKFLVDMKRDLSFFVSSFSFSVGLPREADFVFDVRFLKNPYWNERMTSLNGLDPEVAEYLRQSPDYTAFFANLTSLIQLLIPHYGQIGKSEVAIAFGCSGGRHRSVFVCEEVSRWLERSGYQVERMHRDLTGRGERSRIACS